MILPTTSLLGRNALTIAMTEGDVWLPGMRLIYDKPMEKTFHHPLEYFWSRCITIRETIVTVQTFVYVDC